MGGVLKRYDPVSETWVPVGMPLDAATKAYVDDAVDSATTGAESIFVPAGSLLVSQGAPIPSTMSPQTQGAWSMPDSGASAVASHVDLSLMQGWGKFQLEIWWAKTSTGQTGNVRFRAHGPDIHTDTPLAVNEGSPSSLQNVVEKDVTVPTSGTLVQVLPMLAPEGATVPTDGLLAFAVGRPATSADTVAGDIRIFGVRLVKVS